jgi:hypothetical protein
VISTVTVWAMSGIVQVRRQCCQNGALCHT